MTCSAYAVRENAEWRKTIMNKIPETLAIASIIGISAMSGMLHGNRRREKARSDEHNRTTAEGNKKRNRVKKNKQAKKSRKQNR